MRHLRTIAAVLTAAVCILSLSGCGNDPDRPTMTEEEMPYGATMRQNKTAYAVPISYDRRFIEEDQVKAVADMLGAIQNSDADLYKASTFEFYANYQLAVYSAENMDALMQKIHDSLASRSGSDFVFHMVVIDGISQNREQGNLGTAYTLLGDLYDGSGKFSDTIEDAWEFSMEWDMSYDSEQKSVILNDNHICLFKTADRYYAVL